MVNRGWHTTNRRRSWGRRQQWQWQWQWQYQRALGVEVTWLTVPKSPCRGRQCMLWDVSLVQFPFVSSSRLRHLVPHSESSRSTPRLGSQDRHSEPVRADGTDGHGTGVKIGKGRQSRASSHPVHSMTAELRYLPRPHRNMHDSNAVLVRVPCHRRPEYRKPLAPP